MKKVILFISAIIILSAGIFIGFKIKDSIKEKNANSFINSKNEGNKVIDDVTTIDENVEYSSKDNAVIENLSNAIEEIEKSSVTEKFKDSAKATFISLVDFIFYDGEIKGVTFKELTESGKKKVLELASKIDDAIEAKVPNYKDTISSKTKGAYNEASKLIKKGASNFNDFLKSKLSENSYNAIVDAKDDIVKYTKNAVEIIKDNVPKVFNTAKEKLSEWYKKFKNN